MISIKLNNDIHDSGFFTFETSWLGEEVYDIAKNMLTIPVLNLEVENNDVLKLLNIKTNKTAYICRSYFSFIGVYKVEKKLHIFKNKKFIAKVNDKFEFENMTPIESLFELGGMGVYKGEKYDGMFKIYASECIYTIDENSSISLEFIGMDSFDPINDSWLNSFRKQSPPSAPSDVKF